MKALIVVPFLGLASSGLAQRVWVVAPAAGPGVDFTTIQEAVDAAASGDKVLVRAGLYALFTIRAKSLTVAGEGNARLWDASGPMLEISGIAANQSVVVRGFGTTSPDLSILSISNCQGPVTIEDSRFGHGSRTSQLADAAQVTLTGCTFAGGGSATGATALSAVRSTVFMHRSTVTGISSSSLRAPAPSALHLGQSFLYANTCTFTGGDGAPSVVSVGQCFFPPLNGADALVLADASTVAYHLGCRFVAGQAGTPHPACPPASPGTPIAGPGTAIALGGTAVSTTAAGLTRSSQTASFTTQGPPGASALLALALAQRPLFLPVCNGVFHLDPATLAVLPLGVIPPSGSITSNFVVPNPLVPLGVSVFAQAVAIDQAGSCFAGSLTAVLLLDSRY